MQGPWTGALERRVTVIFMRRSCESSCGGSHRRGRSRPRSPRDRCDPEASGGGKGTLRQTLFCNRAVRVEGPELAAAFPDPVQASLEGNRLPVTPLRTRSPMTPSPPLSQWLRALETTRILCVVAGECWGRDRGGAVRISGCANQTTDIRYLRFPSFDLSRSPSDGIVASHSRRCFFYGWQQGPSLRVRRVRKSERRLLGPTGPRPTPMPHPRTMRKATMPGFGSSARRAGSIVSPSVRCSRAQATFRSRLTAPRRTGVTSAPGAAPARACAVSIPRDGPPTLSSPFSRSPRKGMTASPTSERTGQKQRHMCLGRNMPAPPIARSRSRARRRVATASISRPASSPPALRSR